jgi:hypothetical protein
MNMNIMSLRASFKNMPIKYFTGFINHNLLTISYLCSIKNNAVSQVWWYITYNPSYWVVETGGSQVQGLPGQS